jgi:hypothetical protein
MTAAEEYTAHHAERLEDVMYSWGWRRFEGMFRLHLLRRAREELRQMRDLRIAAIDANTNYDSKENADAKTERVEGLHSAYHDGVRVLYSRADPNRPRTRKRTRCSRRCASARRRFSRRSTSPSCRRPAWVASSWKALGEREDLPRRGAAAGARADLPGRPARCKGA